MRRHRAFLLAAVALTVSLAAQAVVFGTCDGSAVGPGQPLPLCPDRPNCVAGRFSPDASATRPDLLGAILAEPRSELVLDHPGMLVAHFRSRLFGFVDEAVFAIDELGRVSYRSQACSGYYDFGVNRRRMERIQGRLAAAAHGNSEAR